MPAPASAASHDAEAPPWHGGYRYTLENEDGARYSWAFGGRAQLPKGIGDGEALLLVQTTEEDGEDVIDFYYLDPDDRTVLGRQRTTFSDTNIKRATYRYAPPLDLYGFPLHPGKEWSVNSTEHVNYTITYYAAPGEPVNGTGSGRRIITHFSVGDWTTVATPLGEFRALPVTERPTRTPNHPFGLAQNKTLIHYYAPDARYFVKMEDRRGEHGLWRTYNLTSAVYNLNPVPSPHAAPNRAYKGEPVRFDATHSYDADDGITGIQWRLGDGNTSAAYNFTHAYERPGDYTVNVTVTDKRGATGHARLTVHVASRQPIPVLSAPRQVDVGEAFNVSADKSRDPDGRIATTTWDFGDGHTAEGVNATHAYERAGRYILGVTITDSDGVTSDAHVYVQVGNDTTNRTPRFTGPVQAALLTPANGATVHGDTPVTWRVTGGATVVALEIDGRTVWDGAPGEGRHQWNATAAGEGEHLLRVIAFDAEGNVHSDSARVRVAPPQTPDDPGDESESQPNENRRVEERGSPTGSDAVPAPWWAPLAALAAARIARRSGPEMGHKV